MANTKKASETPFPAGKLTPHALSSLVPGEMSDEEYKALCTSIKEDGQQNPIIVFEGQILDGRHRYQACAELNIKPKLEAFKGDAVKARALVLDNNLHRRTLNSMQKALVAARMHLEAPPTAKCSQMDAAARVGVGVATVNLAVRLINSNNTPLIKRCESGNATRAEIDEVLYDREASRQAEAVAPAVDGVDDEGGEGATAPGNVVDFETHPVVAGKPGHPERRSKESPASRVVQAFKGLAEKERIAFVKLGWTWLAPALKAAKVEHEKPADAVVATKPSKPLGMVAPSAQRKAYRKALKTKKAA